LAGFEVTESGHNACLLADIAIAKGVKQVTLVDANKDISEHFRAEKGLSQAIDVIREPLIGGASHYKDGIWNLLDKAVACSDAKRDEDHVIIIDFAQCSTVSLSPETLSVVQSIAEELNMELRVFFALGHTTYDKDHCIHMLNGSPFIGITVVACGREGFSPGQDIVSAVREALHPSHDMVGMPRIPPSLSERLHNSSLLQLKIFTDASLARIQAERAFEELSPILSKYMR
jgi:hypothetical protein